MRNLEFRHRCEVYVIVLVDTHADILETSTKCKGKEIVDVFPSRKDVIQLKSCTFSYVTPLWIGNGSGSISSVHQTTVRLDTMALHVGRSVDDIHS